MTSPLPSPAFAVLSALCFLAFAPFARAGSELSEKYWVVQDHMCQPQGKLAALLNDPYECHIDLDDCEASRDALAGRLDPGFAEMFADMIRIDANAKGAKFVATCDGHGPEFVHLLALKGLAYMKSTKHLPLVHALVEGDRVDHVGPGVRDAVAEALYVMNDKRSLGVMKHLVEYETNNSDYKPLLLQALARFKSDGAVKWCRQQLRTGKRDELRTACVNYLADRKAKGSLKLFERALEKDEENVVRAMGVLGDKKAVRVLRRYLDDNDGRASARIPAVVALVNLGDKRAEKELLAYLSGRTPLSKKELQRKNKERAQLKKKSARVRKAAKKRFNDKWKKRERRTDAGVLHQAAMESILVKRRGISKRVDKALKKAMKKTDDKNWKPHVYATVALAQRGDKRAQKRVRTLLDSPKEAIRKAVLDAVGGRDQVTTSRFMNRGKGAVADKRLMKDIFKFYENEGDARQRKTALRAAAAVRVVSEL